MFTDRRSTKIGAALLIFAVLLRFSGGVPDWSRLELSGLRSFWEDGRVILLPQLRPAPSQPTQEPTQSTEPPAPTLPVFSQEQAAAIKMLYASDCAYRPALAPLLEKPLQWQLAAETPTVLIIHSHGSESYTKTQSQSYQESGDYRTLDTDYNMVAVGDALAQLLEAAGIRVVHDRTLHDYPSYNDSYVHSRSGAAALLQENPGICLVLDLHRDAALESDGSQYATHAVVGGASAAQLMLVVGSDASGRYHPNWRENLSTALKLQVLLEQLAPGITRPVVLRAQRFNQDLSPGAMLVEVGAAGNTLDQALRTVPILAKAIIALADGCV